MKELFEKVRREEVVLWVGAGFSIYAGYPSGNDLSRLLYDSLETELKLQIEKNLSLSDLSEEILRATNYDRNHLNILLNKIFNNINISSRHVHEKLKSIPHINTIITTNYDTLFEDVFGEDCQVFIKNKDVPKLSKKKIQIFKLHGDLKYPESIVITSSDYINFSSDKVFEQPYWSVVKERLATKSVLFIGYNLEDQNILSEIDQLSRSLGEDRHSWFFISPDKNRSKQNHLASKNIQYINDNAESFLDQLLTDIRDNIFSDQKEGLVSTDTFAKFLKTSGLNPTLQYLEKTATLKSISGGNKGIKGKFQFTFTKESREFQKLIKGETFEKIEIQAQSLKNIDIRLEDLRLFRPEELTKISFQSLPRKTSEIDLVFQDGFELSKIPTKVFSSQKRIEFKLDINSTILSIEIDYPILNNHLNLKLSYTISEDFKNVREGLDLFNLLNHLSTGIKFKVYSNSQLIKNYDQELTQMSELKSEAEIYLNYFKILQKIEKEFNVKFYKIQYTSISNENFTTVLNLNKLIDDGYIDFDWDDEIDISFKDLSDRKLIYENIENCSSMITSFVKEADQVLIHNCKILLGYIRHDIKFPKLLNKKEFLNGEVNSIKIKSKNRTLRISYDETPPDNSLNFFR